MRLSYITSVWLLSVFILPLIFFGWELISSESMDIDMAWTVLIGGLIFSLPAYAICGISSQLMLPSGLTLLKQTVVWLIASVSCIGCTSFGLLTFLAGWSFSQETMQFLIAPVLATIISTGALFKKLIRLNINLNNQQSHDLLDTTAVG